VNGAAPAIEARELRRDFAGFQAVRGISFAVAPGEIVGFLGPNGAGKTTTIKMITGLLAITSGSVRVGGLDTREQPQAVKRKLGYMSQKFSLYPLLTARENIEFFGGISGLGAVELRRRLAGLENEFAGAVLRQKVQDIPPGLRQKVALAVCLLPEPEIILLDEPTSGVDPEARREFWHAIYGLKQRGKTLLVSTHNLDEAWFCDRILIIHNGELVADGEPGALLRQRGQPTIEALFRAAVESHGQN
jgi:ABC-2 type transport system ATP-binding protein